MMAALRKQKPWGCFHLSDKAGKWPPSLLERTFDGQRTANGKAARGRPEWSDHYASSVRKETKKQKQIIRKTQNKIYEKHKMNIAKNIKSVYVCGQYLELNDITQEKTPKAKTKSKKGLEL